MTEPKPSLFGEAFRSELKETLREVIREELASIARDDALMDVEQVSGFLRQSEDWVYRHWRQLGGRKIGPKSIRFDRSDIDRWLKSCKPS